MSRRRLTDDGIIQGCAVCFATTGAIGGSAYLLLYLTQAVGPCPQPPDWVPAWAAPAIVLGLLVGPVLGVLLGILVAIRTGRGEDAIQRERDPGPMP